MLITQADQQQRMFESLGDPALFELNDELKAVDEYLNDPKLYEPFKVHFSTKRGRPTVPVSTYLRLMYLKERYQYGYEMLIEEVKDRTKWRKFCQIPLDKKVPDATTLMKLTKRYGPELIASVNKILLEKLKEQKIIKGKKLRVDSTVVESNIHFPTDIGLLSDGVRVVTRTVKKLKEVVKFKTKFRNRTRSVKKIIRNLCKGLKGKKQTVKDNVQEKTKQVMKKAQDMVTEAKDILAETADAAKADILEGIKAAWDDLKDLIGITDRVVDQTENVLAGHKVESRLVSIFDTSARAIKKGKLGVKAEFGHKVVVQDTEQEIITGYDVLEENPSDTSLVEDSLKDHIDVFDEPPVEMATDRGFASADNERKLKEAGVKRLSMPMRGKLSQDRKSYQKQHWFKRLQKFRAGCEAKISLLKRKFGLRRSRLRGLDGTKIHVGWSIFSHNLWQTTRLT